MEAAVPMSDQERGLRSAVLFVLGLIVAVIFGPWLLMLAAAWVLEPRTGSWGAWPHLIGLIWALLVVALLLYGRFKP
jgi:hypothetical protein